MPDTLEPPAADAMQPPPRPACGNCGTALLGEHCYVCGQPVKGLVRHFSSLIGDFFDSVFNFDARTPRTLWPLFARPGLLSLEYFAGRRVRYVSPVRLFFFLAIVTFFFAQFTLRFDGTDINFDNEDADAIGRAATVAEVERQRDQALTALREAQQARVAAQKIGPDAALIAAEVAIRKRAEERIVELREAETAGAAPARRKPGLSQHLDNDPNISFNGRPWHAKTNPLTVSWWPKFANDWLNVQVGRTLKNVERVQEDPSLYKDALLGAVPTALFLMLPLFALMLKVAYVFKRRLYMEHLIVALHSHAFLCLALLLVFVLTALRDALAPGLPRTLLGFGEAALWTWMPLYLLLMQKRVYGQGWAMTLLKYSVLGLCYSVLLSFGAAFIAVTSLVTL